MSRLCVNVIVFRSKVVRLESVRPIQCWTVCDDLEQVITWTAVTLPFSVHLVFILMFDDFVPVIFWGCLVDCV